MAQARTGGTTPGGPASLKPSSAARSQRNPVPSRPMQMNARAQAQARSQHMVTPLPSRVTRAQGPTRAQMMQPATAPAPRRVSVSPVSAMEQHGLGHLRAMEQHAMVKQSQSNIGSVRQPVAAAKPIIQQVVRNAGSSQPRVASVQTGQQSVARSQRSPVPSRPMQMNARAQTQARPQNTMTQAQMPARPPSASHAHYRQHPALSHGRPSAGLNGHPAHGGHPMAMGNPRAMNPTQSMQLPAQPRATQQHAMMTQNHQRNAGSSQPRVASVPTGQHSVSRSAPSQRNPTPSRPMDVRAQAQARPQRTATRAQLPTQFPLASLARKTLQQNLARSQGPTRAQLMPPASAPASELVSVSPASSRPSSSQQFAHADKSTDETVLSSRSSLSSERISPFEPSELTAKRDVYDFKPKRDTIVTRQLRTMTLRNTLELGIDAERADSENVQRLSSMEQPTQQSAVTNSGMSKSARRRARRRLNRGTGKN